MRLHRPIQLVSSLSSLGDLSFSSSIKASDGYGLSPSLGSGLMKSKSDHRLAAQFRDQEDAYGYSGRTSPLMRRRFGERPVERYSLSHLLPLLLTPSQHPWPTNTPAPHPWVMPQPDRRSVLPRHTFSLAELLVSRENQNTCNKEVLTSSFASTLQTLCCP